MYPQNREPHVFACVTCEMPIAGMPVFHVGLPFCCAGCVANGPCGCSYDEQETSGRRRTSVVAPARTAVDHMRYQPLVATTVADADEEPDALLVATLG